MQKLSENGSWSPYIVGGKPHPGVTVDIGMEVNDGATFLAKILPGGFTNPHIHSGEERIEIIEGIAEIELNGNIKILTMSESVSILPGVVHSVRNKTSALLLVRAEFVPPFHQQETRLK